MCDLVTPITVIAKDLRWADRIIPGSDPSSSRVGSLFTHDPANPPRLVTRGARSASGWALIAPSLVAGTGGIDGVSKLGPSATIRRARHREPS